MPDTHGLRSPGGRDRSARRVLAYRGVAGIIAVAGVVIGEPFTDQFIALAALFLVLAELATIARAVEETALQGERREDEAKNGS